MKDAAEKFIPNYCENAPRRAGRALRITVTIFFLLVAAFLTGCAETDDAPEDVTTQPSAQPSVTPVSLADDRFTLDYDKNAGFNPLLCESEENLQISTLMFEGLFTLDGSFNPVPKLCADWSTEDGKTWSFTLLPGVVMHDGATLSAEDAVYSILAAKNGRFSVRFRHLTSATATGELTFTATLSKENRSFLSLLDVPIVKNGSAGDPVPIGTGPYTYNAEASCMRVFPRYRDRESLPVLVIYLQSVRTAELSRAFSTREIDLLAVDPLSTELELHSGHERYEVDTPRLQYVGFNTVKGVFVDARMRAAASYAVDREHIAGTLMKGEARPAPVCLSPALEYYDEAWESGAGYSIREMSAQLSSMGLSDTDGDGLLEIPDGSGGGTDFSIDFIVSDDGYKESAAREIAYCLRNAGMDITVRALPWNDYYNALQAGEFDMYYAETKLTPDFDLIRILGTGGALNYGDYSDDNTDAALDAFIGADDEEARKEAAEQLCWLVSRKAPIVPVLYRTGCVNVNRGVVSGLSVGASGTFCDIAKWEISF